MQYTNPAGYPPLEHSAELLAEAGWEVLFLGTGAMGADSFRLPERKGVTTRRLAFCQPGFRQKLHYLWFCLWCLWWMLRFRAAWVYASDLLACPVGVIASAVLGIEMIYHEHDAPSGSGGANTGGLLFESRAACARRARLCVIPNALRAEAFEREHQATVVVAWNCPTLREVPSHREPADGKIRLLYQGSIVPERVPLELIEALALVSSDIHLVLVGYETVGAPGYVNRLKSSAEARGIGHKLEYLGPLPSRSDLMAVCRTCDVGLALLPGIESDWNLKTMVGASNKVFDYLACGLPVIVSATPEWEQLVVDPGYGTSCDVSTSAGIAQAIQEISGNRDRMRAMGEAGRQRVLSEWNYETQFRPVMNVLNGRRTDLLELVEQR